MSKFSIFIIYLYLYLYLLSLSGNVDREDKSSENVRRHVTRPPSENTNLLLMEPGA